MKKLFEAIRKRQEGQTMAEYAVVLGVITLAVVGVFTALAGGLFYNGTRWARTSPPRTT
jgi:Flp pilus assembly pilin Flp